MKLRKINDIHFVITYSNPATNGDYAIHPITLNFYQHHSKDNNLSEGWEKIEFSTQPLEKVEWGWGKLGYIKIQELSLQEVKELIGEVDVEKKAEELTSHLTFPEERREGIIIGYNQALEDNKAKKYTEEDLKRYHNIMCLHGNKKGEEFIQSLQPKTEWDVEFIDGKLTLKKL